MFTAMPISQETIDRLQANDTRLTKLDLWWVQISPADAKYLAAALKKNNILTELRLWWNKICPEVAEHLAAALKENNTLTELSLAENQIGDAGALHITASLKENKTLTELSLAENQIGDAGALHIAASLKENNTLTELSLRKNQISDAGALHIADALKENNTLKKLNLEGNAIGPQGIKYLADALKENHTLYELLGGPYSPKISALLSRNRKISECLKVVKNYTTSDLLELELEDINKILKTLYELEPRLIDEDNPLPEDNYLSEAYRLLCALSHLQGGHIERVLVYLERPMRHPQFVIIADTAYAEALMVAKLSDDNTQAQIARYKLLAYYGWNNDGAQFETGLAGVALKGEQPNYELLSSILSNPRRLPNGAYWLGYDELQDAANTLVQAGQKDYHPAIVDMLFKSPVFVQELRNVYPGQADFQCLEGYLGLQHVEGLGGVYTLPDTDLEVDHTAIATLDLDSIQRPYDSIQDEILALKRCVTSGLELVNDDGGEFESKESDTRVSEVGIFSSPDFLDESPTTKQHALNQGGG